MIHDVTVRRPKAARVWFGPLSLMFVCVLTALMTGVREHLLLTDVVTLYLLIIMLAAFRLSRSMALAVAALSVAAYDFCFVPPLYQFAVSDTRQVLSFGLMFVTAVTINGLASRIRRQEKDARAREEQARTLSTLTTELATALDDARAAEIMAARAAHVFGGDAAVLLRDPTGVLALKGLSGSAVSLDAIELEIALRAWEQAVPAEVGDEERRRRHVTFVPFESRHRGLGILALQREGWTPDQRRFLDVFVRQAALMIERVQLGEEAKTAALRARTEEMRSSLLSAVSHDLRTPLATITAAGSTLREEEGRLNDGQRAELLETICSESERLERLIGNLLDMMRLESGGLQPKREWVPLEEIVGSALTRFQSRLDGRELRLELPEEPPLVSVDAVLFEQVFLNLLDNALKYTPAASVIEIRARTHNETVEIEVADRGPGLPSGDEATVFAKFWRGSHPGVGGVGLGLSICRGIVHAHGGTITAEQRQGGGASFKISLPVGTAPNVPLGGRANGALSCMPR